MKRLKTALGLSFALAASAVVAPDRAFPDVARGPATVYASAETAALLTAAEKKILEHATAVTLILTPEEILVRGAEDPEDFKASRRNLGEFLGKISPGSEFSDLEKRDILYSLRDVAKHPGQAYHLMPEGKPAIFVISRHPESGTRKEPWYGLADEYVRPEKLRVMHANERLVSFAHELGHSGQGGQKKPENYGLEYADEIAGEAEAEQRGLAMLEGLDEKLFPSRREKLSVYEDQRAIASLLVMVNTVYAYGGQIFSAGAGGNPVLLDDPLHLHGHAITAVMKYNVAPLAALTGSSLAVRPVYRLLGKGPALTALQGEDADRQAEHDARRETGGEDYAVRALGHEYAAQNPLQHYAAVKALLAARAYAEDSVARLYAREYVEAMERMVKPDLLRAAQSPIENFRAAVRASPGAYKVDHRHEEGLAAGIAGDPRNWIEPASAPKQP